MSKPFVYLLPLVLVAFVLRIYSLASPPLAWDEGWTMAVSQIPMGDLAYLTAADVHPPGYYLLMRGWLALGRSEFIVRYLSLIAGVVAVPLAYQAGRAWLGRRAHQADWVGLLAAGYIAIAPILIYYAQVARMYAVCVAGVLLATWGLLRYIDNQTAHAHTTEIGPGLRHWLPLVGWTVGALSALYSFYYSALALVGLGVYVLLRSGPLWRSARGRWGLTRVGLATAVIAVAYIPWLLYAVGPVTERVTTRTEGAVRLAEIGQLLRSGVYAVIFAYGPGWLAVWVVLGVLLAGMVISLLKTKDKRLKSASHTLVFSPQSFILWTLPALAVALTLVAVALGTQAHMFAARYTITASPFIGLALAYGLVSLGGWSRWLGGLALVLVAWATLAPTWDGTVYAKGLERSGAFDPAADVRTLRAAGARSDDLAVFNLLSLAGAYDAYRQPSDPPWTYAQRWDPVTEAWKRAETRLKLATPGHARVWSLLYKGTAGGNAELKDWLDNDLYPVSAQWREDTLVLLHLTRVEPRRDVEPRVTWQDGIVLMEALFTHPATPGGAVTVDLKWQTDREIGVDYSVFVHLYNAAGFLVAQHDGPPHGGNRPMTRWTPGKTVTDYHGLVLPTQVSGALTLRVGLYNPSTGQRLPLMDGRDMADVGIVDIK